MQKVVNEAVFGQQSKEAADSDKVEKDTNDNNSKKEGSREAVDRLAEKREEEIQRRAIETKQKHQEKHQKKKIRKEGKETKKEVTTLDKVKVRIEGT